MKNNNLLLILLKMFVIYMPDKYYLILISCYYYTHKIFFLSQNSEKLTKSSYKLENMHLQGSTKYFYLTFKIISSHKISDLYMYSSIK